MNLLYHLAGTEEQTRHHHRRGLQELHEAGPGKQVLALES